MTKPTYSIQHHDQQIVRQYIQKKLLIERVWGLPVQAEIEFEHTGYDAITLTQWCQQWLDREQWQRLQAALRASRYRQRARQSPKRYGAHVHVRLSYDAWAILTQLAKCDGVTISDFIIHHHQSAYLQWFTQQHQQDNNG